MLELADVAIQMMSCSAINVKYLEDTCALTAAYCFSI